MRSRPARPLRTGHSALWDIQVDATTGQACLLASGPITPTAVQLAESFGAFNSQQDLFVTEATGRIVHVHLDGEIGGWTRESPAARIGPTAAPPRTVRR